MQRAAEAPPWGYLLRCGGYLLGCGGGFIGVGRGIYWGEERGVEGHKTSSIHCGD